MSRDTTSSRPARRPKTAPSGDYDASAITVLEGLEAVRKRPGMYIGSTGSGGLAHLVWEILDNAVDEAIAGHASHVEVRLHADGSVSVTDNGRGIPVDIEARTGRVALLVVLTTLHAGGKFGGGSYQASGGLHGVGASVVNALSERLTAEVCRDAKVHRIEFSRGTPGHFDAQGNFTASEELRVTKAPKGRRTGTTIRWWPDPQVFLPDAALDASEVHARARRITFLVPGLGIAVTDERPDGESACYRSADGLADMVEALSPTRPVAPTLRATGEGTYTETVPVLTDGELRDQEVERTMSVDVALRWCEGYDSTTESFVNVVRTSGGGTHVTGFERALVRELNAAARATKVLRDKDDNFVKDDCLEGLVAVVTVRIDEPQFESQTKDVLGTPPAAAVVNQVVGAALRAFLSAPKSKRPARAILTKVASAAKARIAARAQREAVRKRNAVESSSLPAKLVDCRTRDRARAELALVEGASAMGSARAARDSEFQALLPLRGKVLNTHRATVKAALDNAEIAGIVSAVGAGFGPSFDVTQSRYGKVVILVDADVDGAHIRCLLLTLFHRHMRPLLEAGMVYAAVPPLFKITETGAKGKVHWCVDEAERDAVLARIGAERVKSVMRMKGLGEMDADELRDTTMDPSTRSLRRMTVADAADAASMFELLMGSEVPPRREYITTHAADVDRDAIDA